MQIIQGNDELRLIAQEDFVVTKAAVIHQELLQSVDKLQTGQIILDLSQISLVDSTGIKLVLGLYKTCQQKELSLRVEVSSPAILRLFQLCRLNQLLELQESSAHE